VYGEITHAGHRHIHHAEQRRAVINERDIHGEFAVTIYELLGAVERIDQPEALPAGAFAVFDLGRFLRQNRNGGRECREVCNDYVMRGAIGVGERRAVILAADIELAFVHIQNAAAGLGGDVHHVFQPQGGVGCTSHGFRVSLSDISLNGFCIRR
jgi:hypothetical protein